MNEIGRCLIQHDHLRLASQAPLQLALESEAFVGEPSGLVFTEKNGHVDVARGFSGSPRKTAEEIGSDDGIVSPAQDLRRATFDLG